MTKREDSHVRETCGYQVRRRFHWLKPNMEFVVIRRHWCRNSNDVNKENGWHENTNISNFGILIQENGKSDLQNSFLYGSLKDRCIQEKYFKCKKPIGWFYMEPPTCGRYWIVPGRTLSKKANCHGLKSIYEPDMLFITSFWKYWTLENCLITFLKNVTG